MKFAKEIEAELVPEWASKYLDYKAGKKKIKAVVKAIEKTNATPKVNGKRLGKTPLLQHQTRKPPPQQSPLSKGNGHINHDEPSKVKQNDGDAEGGQAEDEDVESVDSSDLEGEVDDAHAHKQRSKSNETTPMMIPKGRGNAGAGGREPLTRYGSIVATPPKHAHINNTKWDLPDPAITLPDAQGGSNGDGPNSTSSKSRHAYEVGSTLSPKKGRFGTGKASSTNKIVRNEEVDAPPRGLRRLFSTTSPLSRPSSNQGPDYNMEAYEKVRTTQRDFLLWMDGQLNKIETFYKSKEDEAEARLDILRDQLHTLRNNRMQEIAEAHRIEEALREREDRALRVFGVEILRAKQQEEEQRYSWRVPIERALDNLTRKTMGPNSRALVKMPFSPAMAGRLQERVSETVTNAVDPNSDYSRRPTTHEVSYRVAKRKLKLALKEFYRALELLKSYSLLNRTAFRKINKKYDKATHASPPLEYFYEKVQQAHFNQSDLLDKHLHAVEDLYARYFERGNHKVAVGKLRTKADNPGQYVFAAFRSGLCLGLGAVLSIQGMVWAFQIEGDFPDDEIEIQTSYLLQLYAAYFLALYLFTFFAVDCGIWTRYKINYPFIFEFDPRHHLDWRQLAEFPCILFFFFGLMMWINFSRYGSDAMYVYYPVILFGVTALLIFLPAPTLWHRSRKWFVYSHWRLLLAGLYPVEFRDFFLGDMYCSLTYFMGNIELFFCLYAHNWTNESQCNSSNSRLLGFFSALPGIWRALQSLRRYYDTRNAFPHLANFGKYLATILYYTSLSMFRINKTTDLLAVFIVFASINAIYTSTWDLLMDWSLFQPSKRNPYLRDTLGYKSPTFYYFAMFFNVLLRFNWVFYVAYTRDVQHSSVASFLVSFSEINRRGIWTLLRVENEHCSNVQSFKASRDIKLPYDIPASKVGAENDNKDSRASLATSTSTSNSSTFQGGKTTGSDVPPTKHKIDDHDKPLQPTSTNEEPSTTDSTEAASTALRPHRSNLSDIVDETMRKRIKAGAASEGDIEASSSSGTSRWSKWGHPKRTLTKVLANAHRQDFEKKKVGGSSRGGSDDKGGSAAGGDEGIVGDSSDEDDDDDYLRETDERGTV